MDCILSDREPKVTAHDGKMAVKVVNAGNESIVTGQIVRLQKEKMEKEHGYKNE